MYRKNWIDVESGKKILINKDRSIKKIVLEKLFLYQKEYDKDSCYMTNFQVPLDYIIPYEDIQNKNELNIVENIKSSNNQITNTYKLHFTKHFNDKISIEIVNNDNIAHDDYILHALIYHNIERGK